MVGEKASGGGGADQIVAGVRVVVLGGGRQPRVPPHEFGGELETAAAAVRGGRTAGALRIGDHEGDPPAEEMRGAELALHPEQGHRGSGSRRRRPQAREASRL